MEHSEIAIVSNGRTVYELAHMNIPAIVISMHERELTHNFACEENGFMNLGLYKKDSTPNVVHDALERLIVDTEFRSTLFKRTLPYQFNKNKERVLEKILSFLK